jgi:hypothetical protein
VRRVLHRVGAADAGDYSVRPNKSALPTRAIARDSGEPPHCVETAFMTRAFWTDLFGLLAAFFGLLRAILELWAQPR